MRDLKEIEYAFLGCIFDKPSKRITEAQKVKANENWFSDQTCRLAWKAIESLSKKNSVDKIKPLLIIDEAIKIAGRKKSPFYGQKITTDFIDEAKRFRDAAEDGENATIEAYAPILRDAAQGRLLDSAMAVAAKDDGRSNADRMMELSKQIEKIQKDESPDTGVSIESLVENMMAGYDKAYEEFAVKHNYNYIPGIPYPWDCVSHLTKGLNPGLHIIAARPSVGKTSFINQCMTYWCDLGYKVAFDCLDMSTTELIKRPTSNLAWVSMNRMEFGWANPEEQYRTREAAEKIVGYEKAGLLKWTVEFDVDKLKTWAEIRHRAGKLDILIIDYVQNFTHAGLTSEYEIATYASGVLKRLSNECLLPVIILSQLSRDNVKDPNGKRPPDLADLRGSGALEQNATTVVLLHKVKEVIDVWRNERPMYFVDETDDERLLEERASTISAVNWNLAKNQNGATGEIPFVVFQNCLRWYVGDEKAEKAEQYQRITADWRFMEQPFKTAEKKGAVVYPMFWPQKCAEMCGKMGVEIPPHIREQLSKWDIERYNNLLKEHSDRMVDAQIAISTPMFKEPAPPSISDIKFEDPPELNKQTDQIGIFKKDDNADLDRKLQKSVVSETGTVSSGEPSLEDDFEDEDF